MSRQSQPRIQINPTITADQLFAFYKRNDICEVGFGKDVATRVLDHPHLIVAALDQQDDIVGLVRATFDGLSAHIMEFSVDLRWQGQTKFSNGSLVESDSNGLGLAMGQKLLAELKALGCTFISGYIVQGAEEQFYKSLGFRENEGHAVYCIDERPYAGSGD